MRKNPLANGQYYHILSRSIAKFKIFNNSDDYNRFLELLDLDRFSEFQYKYSKFKRLSLQHQKSITDNLIGSSKIVEIVAYCIMPTHFHLLLKQTADKGITNYLKRLLDGYTRYFNIKYHRTGPLWEGRFKNVLVNNDEQLLHLTRYIHLNPVSANLVKKPEQWVFSSYQEYIDLKTKGLCEIDDLVELSPKKYKTFVKDRIAYQKELSEIKRILIENYTG